MSDVFVKERFLDDRNYNMRMSDTLGNRLTAGESGAYQMTPAQLESLRERLEAEINNIDPSGPFTTEQENLKYEEDPDSFDWYQQHWDSEKYHIWFYNDVGDSGPGVGDKYTYSLQVVKTPEADPALFVPVIEAVKSVFRSERPLGASRKKRRTKTQKKRKTKRHTRKRRA